MINTRREFVKSSALAGLFVSLGSFSFAMKAFDNISNVILDTEFKTDPKADGWVCKGANGGWLVSDAETHQIYANKDVYWESGKINISPYQFCKLTFRSRAKSNGYWAAVFYDKNGKECVTDVYDSLIASDNLEEQVYCFRVFADAQKFCLRFHSISDKIEVDAVKVSTAEPDEVAAWIDDFAAKLPPIDPTTEFKKDLPLIKTSRIINSGATLRVIMLGDSIINDIGNSVFEAKFQQLYKNVKIEVVNSVRGSTGCEWYQSSNRIQEYVLRFNPDLLIIGGISNNYNVAAIQSVIKQVRAVQTPDIVFVSDCITSDATMYERFNPSTGNKDTIMAEYPAKLKLMLAAEQVNYFDLRTFWNTYTANSGKPYDWFMRDYIHSNSRGKQAVGYYLYNALKANIEYNITGSNPILNQKTGSVYPNPSTGKFYFKNTKVNQVEVYDMTGRMVISIKNIRNAEIDLSRIKRGSYILKTFDGKSIERLNVLINK